jgi:hypothetical protein
MRDATRMFFVLAGFFVLITVVYVLWGLFFDPSYTSQGATGGGPNHIEWVGTVALALCAILSGLIAFFMARTRRGQTAELPEDRDNALIDEGDAEQGFFSPWSWWPVSLGTSAALMFVGLAVGNWLCFIAVPLLAISVLGLIFEYQRGYFGH